jgi:hypothetical protein
MLVGGVPVVASTNVDPGLDIVVAGEGEGQD